MSRKTIMLIVFAIVGWYAWKKFGPRVTGAITSVTK